MRRIWQTAVVLALTGVLMAGAIPRVRAATAQDTIKNFAFSPNPITIQVGDTVTWTNQDSAPHTATSDTPGLFDTGQIQQNQSKSITFTQAGTFTYHCSVHPNMKATLIVQGVPLSASPIGMPSFHLGAVDQSSTLHWTAFMGGRQVSYLVTDASDRSQATSLRVNFAPLLARGNNLARIYLIAGRSAPQQLAVLSSGPGSSSYSPLRQEIVVRWRAGHTPVLLTREAQIRNLAAHGALTLHVTRIVLNAPALPSSTT